MSRDALRPNIVLIVCDQLRGDCLGAAGHPDVKTPYLDTLAAEGALFENAYSACPSCIPARAALLTGRSQERHGRVGYQDGIDWRYDHYLAEELGNAGYQTACVGKMHVHPPRLACGFQTLKLHDGYIGHYRHADTPYWQNQAVSDDYMRDMRDRLGASFDVNGSGVENNSWIAHPWIYEERYHPTNWVVDESIRFLETRDRTRPFFLTASFVRPHPPFDAPQSYFDGYYDRDLRAPACGDWDDTAATERDGMVLDSVHGCRDAELRRQAMVGYYACITHVDHQVGRLITALENDGTYADTVVVFTSDHGEMLFDHSLFRKVLPYEGSAHIPLIVRAGKRVMVGRGAEAVPAGGRRVRGVVELRDIMPTLLDFAGAPVPGTVDGVSLAAAALGTGAVERPYLHGEHARDREQSNHYIVTQNDKYIWFSQSGREQYFRLDEDPREEHDAIRDPACAERIGRLRSLLAEELAGRREGFVESGSLVAGRPVSPYLG